MKNNFLESIPLWFISEWFSSIFLQDTSYILLSLLFWHVLGLKKLIFVRSKNFYLDNECFLEPKDRTPNILLSLSPCFVLRINIHIILIENSNDAQLLVSKDNRTTQPPAGMLSNNRRDLKSSWCWDKENGGWPVLPDAITWGCWISVGGKLRPHRSFWYAKIFQ